MICSEVLLSSSIDQCLLLDVSYPNKFIGCSIWVWNFLTHLSRWMIISKVVDIWSYLILAWKDWMFDSPLSEHAREYFQPGRASFGYLENNNSLDLYWSPQILSQRLVTIQGSYAGNEICHIIVLVEVSM